MKRTGSTGTGTGTETGTGTGNVRRRRKNQSPGPHCSRGKWLLEFRCGVLIDGALAAVHDPGLAGQRRRSFLSVTLESNCRKAALYMSLAGH